MDAVKKIREASTALKAKRAGNTVKEPVEWGIQKVTVMEEIFIIQDGLMISTMLCLTLCLAEGCRFIVENILIWISFIGIKLQMAEFYYSMLNSIKNSLSW